jgi:hypothetical protein
MPAFHVQPFLQGMKMNLWVPAPKSANICLEAALIEPPEHQVKLFAQDKPHKR